MDFLANSIVLWRFATCVGMAFACCVAGAILWKCVNVLPCRFLVAGTALSADAFYITLPFRAGAAFCDVAQRLF